MVRIFLALLALCLGASAVFAGGSAVAIPPIWSMMLLVIITAFFLAACAGVRELDTLGGTAKRVITTLLLALWMYAVYYFI